MRQETIIKRKRSFLCIGKFYASANSLPRLRLARGGIKKKTAAIAMLRPSERSRSVEFFSPADRVRTIHERECLTPRLPIIVNLKYG